MIPKRLTRVADIGLPKDYDMDRDGITQSLLSTFLTCRQKFVFVINRWTPVQGRNTTSFGTLFHEMLDKAYHQTKPPSPAILGRWIDEFIEGNEERLGTQNEDSLGRMASISKVLLEEYIRYYPEDWTKKKFTSVERAFNFLWNGFRLRGKKDGNYKDKSLGNWLMEHKTKGFIDEDYLMLHLTFDLQNLFYITAEEAEFKIRLLGCLYNIVRNPGLKPKVNESTKGFAERIRADVRKRPDHYFKRYEIRYPELDKDRFKKELLSKLVEVKMLLGNKLPVYRNETACHRPYKCTFLEACSTGSMVGYKQKPKLFEELEDTNDKKTR